MAPPDALAARVAEPIAAAVKAYLSGGSATAFEQAMQAAITRAHTAAYLRGLAERSAGGRVREWLSRIVGVRALPSADRAALRERLAEQFGYLRGFVDALPGMSDAAIAARAGLYGGAARASYWQAWAGAALECLRGGCESCFGRCRCSLDRTADGIYWRGPGDAHSCAACKGRIGRRMD